MRGDLPPGFQLDAPTTPPRPNASGVQGPRPIPLLTDLTATGDVVDGDTIRLNGGVNGRLYGFDAFEKGQPGFRPDGTRVDLGSLALDALTSYVRPSQSVAATGKQTFGRPVITLGDGSQDPALPMLWQGAGYAAPEYLRDDPQRAASYTEAERLGRLNRQGGFGTGHIRPDAYRRPLTTRTAKLAADEFLAFDDQLPPDAPKLKRLTDDQEKKIAAYIATKAGDPNFNLPEYQRWFRDELGVTDIQPSNADFIESVRKGEGFSSAPDYSTLDAESQRDLKELIAFSGMRPEDAQGYRDLLKGADQAQVLEYARSRGMTLDPRDLSAYFAARAKGENAPIPLPLINPGDGRTGAAARGFGDPLGFLDEMGGIPDTLGITANRENIWNSDRSFGDIYDNNTRQNRAIIDYDETHHPYMRAGGQLISGLALPFGGGVRGAAGLAKAGAIEGGIYGFGSGDGSLGQRLANVPLNAAGGALAGGTLGKVIDVAAPIAKKGGEILFPALQDTVQRFARTRSGLPAATSPNAGGADLPAGFTLDEPLTTGGTPLEQAAGQKLGQVVQDQRADMAGDGMPSLSSPRIPDVINVNADRTARLMDDARSYALMRQNASRVAPGDVLPRAANEVQSLDEFGTISDGIYPEVPAPRERDFLEPRQYPSRANPENMLTRRGPADLVTFTRAQGGVIDQGGEMTAAGISNAARKGEDFAGGENRLGRLVNNESGAALDDMAQRAWNEGYFPELDRPPTVQEFVAALDDTYRGVGRRFRPDDEAEIQAFEGARDQRLAVERSRQEGAPLADDLGQPATYDDIIANSPPAHAYDDWTNAVVSKVGNIRVDKLDSPQDIGQALKIADNVGTGFDAARRGKISFAETQALAQDLGMTADDLLARRKGQAFSAEEAYAARAILAKSGNELVNMAKRIRSLGDDPGSEALAAFRKSLVRHAAIQEQVSGMTAEAGRALSAFRMAADSRDIPGRVLEGLAHTAGGAGRLKDAADRIIDLERDPANLNRFIEKVSKPKFSDRAQEIWYNYLLSGPTTHMVNILSNAMTAVSQIPEHAVAAGVGATRRAFKRDEADRVLFSELGARTIGLLQGTKEGIREFARAFRTGEASDFATKMESQTQKAVPGIQGELLRIPTRLLTAEDELFKAMARRMELSGLAVRQAAKEGRKGQEGKDRVAELIANPTDAMMEKVLDYGRYLTFQRPLGDGLAGGLSRITQNQPFLKAVLPFIRTPTNLIKFTAERSPLAPMVKEWRKDFAAGGARRDLAIAKVMVGSGIGAAVAELAEKGVITGSPPSDDNQRRLMLANGWQPRSIKIGDQYYSYSRLDPFAMTIGTAADLATLGNGMTDGQREKGAALWTASVVSNLASRTWLSGIADALDALNDPERYSGNFIKRLIGSATVPTGSAQLARAIDPTMREAPDIASYMQSRMPGLTDELLPRRDVWGRPIASEGGVGPDILSPIWTSTDQKDPITAEALRVNATISKPKKGDLNPEQYDRLQEVAGSVGRKWIGQLIASPEYRVLDIDAQAKEIGDVMNDARKAAKAAVLTGEPILDQRPVKGERRPAGLPAGFEMDPLPSGFELDP